MSGENISLIGVTERDVLLESAVGYVRHAVATERRVRDLKMSTAIEVVAQAFGITRDRAKKLFYREIFAVTFEEYRRLKGGYLARLDVQHDALITAAAELRALRDRLAINEGNECFDSFSSTSANGNGTEQ